MAKNRDRGGKHTEFLMVRPAWGFNITAKDMKAIAEAWCDAPLYIGETSTERAFIDGPDHPFADHN